MKFVFFNIFFLVFLFFSVNFALSQSVDVIRDSDFSVKKTVDNAISAKKSENVRELGDWTLRCSSVDRSKKAENRDQRPDLEEGGEKSLCQLTQSLAPTAGGDPVFMTSLVRAGPHGPTVMIVSEPLGGYLPLGAQIRLDGQPPVKLLFETCNANGCHGGFSLSGIIRKKFLNARKASIRVWLNKSKAVDVAISLNGFVQGVQALEASE